MIIQSLWYGDKLSDLEILSINSFLKYHTFHLYIYTPISNIHLIKSENFKILDGNNILNLNKLKLNYNILPFSDLFRYKLLYIKGGIWVDLDMICLKKFNFKEKYIFSSERTIQQGAYRNRNHLYVPNIGVLKAPKKSKFYKELYDKCLNKLKINSNLMFMNILKKQIYEYNFEKYIKEPIYFCPIDWWNTKQIFIPPCCPTKYGVDGIDYKEIMNESYSIHIWRSIMIKRKINPNNKFSNISIYEKLKKLNKTKTKKKTKKNIK